MEPTALQETKSTNSETREILAKLNPEKVTDEDGIERNIYTFHTKKGLPVRVMFYPPQELPLSPKIVAGREGFVYGNQPKHRSPEEWQHFLETIRQSSKSRNSPTNPLPAAQGQAINSGEAVILVESSPEKILNLVFTLGLGDQTLREARKLVSEKRLTPQMTAIIDRLIAGKIISDTDEIQTTLSDQGEALVVSALLGDKSAQYLLDHKAQVLDDTDQQTKSTEQDAKKEQLSWYRERRQPTNLAELVAVHATGFPPRRNSSGRLEIASTFDATHWNIPRDTIHFSLNHLVQNHNEGDWSDRGCVIISPLDKLIALNGNPYILFPVDTVFEVSPGTRLELPPETSLIRSGKVDQLINKDGQDTFIKEGNYTIEDIKEILAPLTQEQRYNLQKSIANTFNHAFALGVISSDQYKALSILLDLYNTDGINFIQLIETKPLAETIEVLEEKAQITPLTQEFKDQVIRDIQIKLFALLKDQVVSQVLQELGYKKQPGGHWAWGDSQASTEEMALLADQLGVKNSAHSFDVTSLIAESVMSAQQELDSANREKIIHYRQRKEQVLKNNLKLASQKSRRMLYLLGIL